jgi:uncharacterized protein (DUF1015 family)
MPMVYPFQAVQYQGGAGDVSALVAPPYDVLDAAAKASLLSRDARNVVAIDLPHVPAKKLGPAEAYSGAAARLESLLADGTLRRRERPIMGAYRQRFEFRGKRYERSGMACTVETAPFGPREGGGILAHEQTFSGPKEDRLALMRATKTQLSPIFGLHADDAGRATALLHRVMESRGPDMTATTDDGVTHEVWTIEDDATIGAYQDALAGEDVFVADGHHRYTTGINYLAELEAKEPVASDHPARRCMIVLVGMSDPGLAIGPTHRVLGGMKHYSIEAFEEAAAGELDIEACENDPAKIEEAMATFAAKGRSNVFGLIDFATGLCFVAAPAVDDPLEDAFGDRCEAWRRLDVAIIQHLIVEEICRPKLNDGEPVTWAFPHTIQEVMEIASGAETGAGGGSGFAQLGIVVRPTPLKAVREISAAGELMPQKSTYFYPKLATGLFLNPLS